MEREIINVLINELDYSLHAAVITARDLLLMTHDDLKLALNEWIKTRNQTVVQEGQLSTTQLVNDYGLRYPAALLFIEWLRLDPRTALDSLSQIS